MRLIAAAILASLLSVPTFAQMVSPPVIADSFSISGTVSAGKATPLAGAKVYLKSQVYYILAKTAAPSDPYTIITDSAETNASGAYAFRKKPADSYVLRFAKSGYLTRDTAVTLTRDTIINLSLLAGVDPVPLKGAVTTADCPGNPLTNAPCAVRPIAGCTVTVRGARNVYPVIDAMAPIIAPIVFAKTVTDAQGKYAFPDLVMQPTERVTVTVAAPGYLSQKVDTIIYSTKETTLNFSLLLEYQNTASKVIDSVLYAFAVDKKTYAPGERLRARYLVTNNKRTTIRMQWGPCDFDMTVTDAKGRQLYQFLHQRVCPMIYIEKPIAPGETAIWESYDPYQIPAGHDTLTVTGVPVAVAKAAISVGIRISAITPATLQRMDGLYEQRLAAGKGRLLLMLDRSRTLSAAGIRPDGSVTPIFVNRFFAAGAHAIALDSRIRGVTIVQVSGNDFNKTYRVASVR